MGLFGCWLKRSDDSRRWMRGAWGVSHERRGRGFNGQWMPLEKKRMAMCDLEEEGKDVFRKTWRAWKRSWFCKSSKAGRAKLTSVDRDIQTPSPTSTATVALRMLPTYCGLLASESSGSSGLLDTRCRRHASSGTMFLNTPTSSHTPR